MNAPFNSNEMLSTDMNAQLALHMLGLLIAFCQLVMVHTFHTRILCSYLLLTYHFIIFCIQKNTVQQTLY